MNNATHPTDINGNSYNRNLLVLVLMVGSFCTFLNSTLMNTAFPAIMKDFSISTATVQWLLILIQQTLRVGKTTLTFFLTR